MDPGTEFARVCASRAARLLLPEFVNLQKERPMAALYLTEADVGELLDMEIAIGLGGKYITGANTECRALGGRKCAWDVHGRVDEAGLGPNMRRKGAT